MNDKPTELEIKLLMLLLMHGGEHDLGDTWWKLRRTVDPDDTQTFLRDKGFAKTDRQGDRIYITEKGRKAVEEATCQKTG